MDTSLQYLDQHVSIALPYPEPTPIPTSLTSLRLSPTGSGRSQPEGSSGSHAPLRGGRMSARRPLSPVGSSAPDRSQPEGSQRLQPADSPLDPKRSQPEGSCPGLLSPAQQYRPLPPPPVSPHRSPAPSPRGSPERSRSHLPARPTRSQEPSRPRSGSSRPSQELTLSQELTGASAGRSSQEGTGEDFRVYIITWNVGCAVPPADLTSLLCLNAGDGKTDLFVIGLQEVNSMINKRLKDALFTDQWSDVFMDVLSPFSYVL
ncbi:hypothetical protein FKM82_023683, partial [Ascaphus truei]